MMLNNNEIYELSQIFINSGYCSPNERIAAYALAVEVPNIMMENARLEEKLFYVEKLLENEKNKNKQLTSTLTHQTSSRKGVKSIFGIKIA